MGSLTALLGVVGAALGHSHPTPGNSGWRHRAANCAGKCPHKTSKSVPLPKKEKFRAQQGAAGRAGGDGGVMMICEIPGGQGETGGSKCCGVSSRDREHPKWGGRAQAEGCVVSWSQGIPQPGPYPHLSGLITSDPPALRLEGQHWELWQNTSRGLRSAAEICNPLYKEKTRGLSHHFPIFSAYKTGSCTAHDQGPEAGLTLQGRAQRGACPLRGRARIHFAAEQNGRVPFLPVRPKGRGIGGRAEHTEEQ